MIARYAGTRALVTGGTGSFGQTVVRHLLRTDVEEVRVLSRDESKHDQMRQDLADPRVRFYVGDVRDYLSVERASRDTDLVFHAAALKQVPSCEFFPVEAVRTNIIGSDNVVRACESNGVRSVVFLSTDKAVYPINAMGMTKAMMEKVAVSHGLNNPNTATVVSRVRYGNVMYSRGSVIPLFVRQLTQGRPITVTHPDMTRFMMSLADSVDLVEYAFTHAQQGDLFIRKAPACTLADLVTALGDLFGMDPKVEVIGIRHGEKMAESLASQEELARAADCGDYFRIPADMRDLNYGLYFDEGDTDRPRPSNYDSSTTARLDVDGVAKLLLTLPEIQDELVGVGRLPAGVTR
jgi:UDP-N-acetylglucosamine 4,6-dehydratase/5-epimerase